MNQGTKAQRGECAIAALEPKAIALRLRNEEKSFDVGAISPLFGVEATAIALLVIWHGRGAIGLNFYSRMRIL
jgi:hypothetical protein